MHKLKNAFLILFLILLANTSCKNIFRKDLSLMVKEYQSLGMPDIDTVWTYNYLVKAHGIIANLRMKNFFSLPRYKSRKSGAIFSRIINKDNLSFLKDTTTSLRDKALQIQSFWSFISDIGRMYTDNLRIKQYYSAELIEIYTFDMYVRKKMFELAGVIDKSKVPDDISMQQGRTGIIIGYVNLITFLIHEQEKTKSFSPRQLNILNSEVARSITDNIQYLDSESKQKLSDEIKKITEGSSSGSKRKHLNKILKLISG